MVLERGPAWCKVSWKNAVGYVQTGFLAFTFDQAQTPKPTPEQGYQGESARVNTRSGPLNLRESASLSARQLASIPQNSYVQVISRQGTWTQCTYKGITGYVMSTFLAFGEQERIAAPSPSPAPASEQPAREEEEEIPANTEASPAEPDLMRDPSLISVQEPYSVMISPDGLSLNLRRGCSTESTVIREMPKGDSLLILERGDDWCRVIYDGQEGFCMSRYLNLPSQ